MDKQMSSEMLTIYSRLKSKINEKETADIEINENGDCYVQSILGKWSNIGHILSENEILHFARLIASISNKTINEENPFIDTEIPLDNARINITIPPLTKSPTLSLRFHHIEFRNLTSLIEKEMLTREQAEKLKAFIKEKKNIIIAGGTNSGKSTLLNALANEIPEDERIIVIEDTSELILDNIKNTTYLLTTPSADSVKCVEIVLRKNPDRIIYGEVRGGEALSLIEAWNTAHRGGLATIHCDDVYTRLKSLCGHKSAMDQSEQIKEAIDVIVKIGFENGKRKILEIIEKPKNKYSL